MANEERGNPMSLSIAPAPSSSSNAPARIASESSSLIPLFMDSVPGSTASDTRDDGKVCDSVALRPIACEDAAGVDVLEGVPRNAPYGTEAVRPHCG